MKKIFRALLPVFVLLLLVTCSDNNFPSGPENPTTGELRLSFPMNQGRTIDPDISMDPVEYLIQGTSLKGAEFRTTSFAPSHTISNLIFDTWTVYIEAENAAGTIIGSGTGTAIVHAGQTTSLNISVTPLTGSGSFDLTATWPASDLEYPTIQSQLIPVSGAPLDLDFNISPEIIDDRASANYSNYVATGYHTIVFKLCDGNPAMTTPMPVIGRVEVVRIIKDQLSTDSFDFDEVNRLKGGIQVMITPEMANPIPVAITGQTHTIAVGEEMTVTASVPADTGNVTYVWYINGESVDIGPSYTVKDLLSGVYNLSVTAFTVDGKRGGSANYQFSVLSAIWDGAFDGSQAWTRTVHSNSNTTAPLYMDTENNRLYARSTNDNGYYSSVSFLTESTGDIQPSYSTGKFYIGTMDQQGYYNSVSFNCFVDDSTIVYSDSRTSRARTQSGLSFVVHQNADSNENNHLYLYVFLDNTLLATVYNRSGLGLRTPCSVKYKIEGDQLYAALWLASEDEPAYETPVATIDPYALTGRKFVIANGMYQRGSSYKGKFVSINSAHLENYKNISQISH